MTGSTPFSIERGNNFQRSLKKLVKVHKEKFIELTAKTLEDLIEDPHPNNSRQEPLPSKTSLPEGWTFRKLEFWFAKGASGQIRLMYLVNETTCTIRLLWIYSHEQFAKRPGNAELNKVIWESLDLEN